MTSVWSATSSLRLLAIDLQWLHQTSLDLNVLALRHPCFSSPAESRITAAFICGSFSGRFEAAPIRRMRSCCCARAASGHAAAAPPHVLLNPRIAAYHSVTGIARLCITASWAAQCLSLVNRVRMSGPDVGPRPVSPKSDQNSESLRFARAAPPILFRLALSPPHRQGSSS